MGKTATPPTIRPKLFRMSGLVDIFLSCHPAGLAPLFVSLFLSDSEKTHKHGQIHPLFLAVRLCVFYIFNTLILTPPIKPAKSLIVSHFLILNYYFLGVNYYFLGVDYYFLGVNYYFLGVNYYFLGVDYYFTC
jgi:hypothetical protein